MNATETPLAEPEFNVEEIYNETVERIEKSHESQNPTFSTLKKFKEKRNMAALLVSNKTANEAEGCEKVLAVGAQNNAARAEEKRNKAAFSEFEKADMITETPSGEPEFNVEEIYNETAERIEKSHESQMRNSAVSLPHSEGQSTPSTMQSPHSAVQTQPKFFASV